MRKVLGSIALLVLLLNTLLTPITYAGEYEDKVGTGSESVTEEVVEENGEEENSSEFSVEEKLEEEINEDDIVDDENYTGDIIEEGTGEVSEMGSGEVEEITGENIEGITGSIIELLTGFEEELTGEIAESIGTGDETEIEDIKYNEEPIIGEKTYDNVTVKVEALSGIFPEGTELKIEPIKWWNLSSLKDKLVEEKEEIKEDTTVVAFDITFIYSGEEVQPKEGEKVKVTFDYKNNDDLIEADEQDNKEVKVYHIEDKDEEARENIIEDITNNEESEENGIAVADGERFSIYAVVTVVGDSERVTINHNLNGGYWMEGGSDVKAIVYTKGENGDYTPNEYHRTPSKDGYMFMGWYDESLNTRWLGNNVSDNMTVYAKWQEFQDLDVYILGDDNHKYLYSLMDRNMGAESQNKAGYYYQWGNNFGFDSNAEKFSISTAVDSSIYSRDKPYTSYKFVKNANWMESTSSLVSLRGRNENDVSRRQGPCPSGYHVPTKDEREGISDQYNGIEDDNYKFRDYLLLPAAGYFSRKNGKIESYGVKYRYASSSLLSSNVSSDNGDNNNRKLYILTSESADGKLRVSNNKDKDPQYEWMSNGLSVRCFKDDPSEKQQSITFNLNGGGNAIFSVLSGVVILMKEPQRDLYQFLGWYDNEDFSGNPIEIKVGTRLMPGSYFAKWEKLNTSIITYDLQGGFLKSTDDGIATNPTEISQFTPTFTLNNPGKLNATFIGWTGTNLTEPVMSLEIPIGSTGDREYIALYECDSGYYLNNNFECVGGIRNADGTLNFDVWEYDDINFEVGYTKIPMMDRNLGATSNDIGSPDSFGFYYKWGNNFGFSSDHTSKYGATRVLVDDISGYGPKGVSGYYLSKDWIYLEDETQDGNRYRNYNYDLWGGLTNTELSRKGPCAENYHVPSYEETNTLISLLNNEYANSVSGKSCISDQGNKRLCFQKLMKIPTAGYVSTDKSSVSIFDSSKSRVFLWTTTKYPSKNTIYAIHSTNNGMNDAGASMTMGERGSINAMPVRCFKNLGEITVNYDFNGGYYYFDKNIYEKPSKTGYWYNLKKADVSPLSLKMKRENSEFGGWYLDPEYTKEFTGGTVFPYITQDTTFYAKFTCNNPYVPSEDGRSCIKAGYTISITPNDGSFGSVTSGTVLAEQGTTISINSNKLTIGSTEISAISATNTQQYTYQFSGWNNTCGNTVQSNCSIQAEFTRSTNSYTITFVSNGGTAIQNQERYYGEYAYKPYDPLKNGYKFDGWYSDSELTNKYDFSSTIDGNINLYAKWTPINYSIEYVTDGGTFTGGVVNPTEYTIESSTINVDNPEKTGYEFMGWTGTGLSGLTLQVTITEGSTGNRSFYANWQPRNDIKVTINHYLQDLDEVTNTLLNSYSLSGTVIIEGTANSEIAIEPLKQMINGYSFEYGKVKGKEESNTTVLPDGSRVIDLYYTRNESNFKLITSAGSITEGSSLSGKYYYGAKIILSGDNNNDCFVWNEWSIQGINLDNNKNQTSFYMPDNDVTAEPSIREKTYNIVFNGNGASSGEMAQIYGITCSQSLELPENVFEKTGHTFSGWTMLSQEEKMFDNKSTIQTLTTGDSVTIELLAVWDINYYQIKWVNDDGAVLYEQMLPYMETPIYQGGENPSKAADPQYTYYFSGWTPTVHEVIEDQVYTAVYRKELNKYTITWNVDGTETTESYYYGDTPNYKGSTHKNPDEQYEYIFSGWSPVIANVTQNVKYTAIYTPKLRTYTVTWQNWNGIKLEVDKEVAYGDPPKYDGENPTRSGDVEHNYEFIGWTPEVTKVTGDITYVATYKSNKNEYTITWLNDNNEQLETDFNVQYGTMPEYNGQIPVKESDAQYDYEFSGWNPSTGMVVGDQVYYATYKPKLRTYTVTRLNSNGLVIKKDEGVEYGTKQEYSGVTPVSGSSAEYSYEFMGWNPAVSEINGDTTYTAVYDKNKRKYIIRFINGVTELQSGEVEYGATPTFNGATPIKTGNAQYSYKFDGWEPEILAVTGDFSYSAKFEETLNKYNVSFENDDGSVLKVGKEYGYGTSRDDIEKPNNPTKQEDAQYSYEFIGWAPNLSEIKGDVVFKATYKSILKKYTITWKNYDGTVLETDYNVPYGTMPSYNGETPIKPSTSQYSYKFIGWDPAVSEVNGETTYIAQFEEVPVLYTIIWENYDGTVLETDKNVPYGTIPNYDGETPIKISDSKYEYRFDGWSPSVSEVVNNQVYLAIYTPVLREYSVIWKNRDGTIIETDENIPYGVTPTFDGENPVRTGNAQYSYTFIGWSPSIHPVDGYSEYIAQYHQTINIYDVTWENEDGTLLDSDQVEYGNIPVYKGVTPVKEKTPKYTYTFNNTWSPEIQSVTEDITYKAQFDSTINTYTITWKDGDGNLLYEEQVEYGKTPIYSGDTPTKSSTDEFSYTFNNTWSPSIALVTEDATYMAQFDSSVNKYSIIWKDWDGNVLKTGENLEYGSHIIDNKPSNPSRESTAQYDYIFTGWYDENGERLTSEIVLTGNISYTAKYDEELRKYTIIWKNSTGSILKSDENILYGTMPSYDGENPTSGGNAQYTYSFDGWTPEISEVVKDQVYTASYKPTKNKYLIRFVDENGTELQSSEEEYGETPIYKGEVPTKAADAQYTYSFDGWTPEISGVTKAQVYTARYDNTVNKYMIKFVNEDGTELQSSEVEYGETPTYNGVIPTKIADVEYSYTFAGWDRVIQPVTESSIYTAVYSHTTNKYPITWKDEDGSEIMTTQLLYGDIPSYTGSELTKEGYHFNKWTPDIEPVVGTASYTANYMINSYNVTPIKGVGVSEIIGGGLYEYNSTVILTGIAKDGYHFEGGESIKEFIVTVPSDSIKVTITAQPNTYHIHFKPNGGTGEMPNQEFIYDEEQELTPNAYTRSGFTFVSWTDGEGRYYSNKMKVKNLAKTGSVILLALWFEGEDKTPPEPSGGWAAGGGRRVVVEDNVKGHNSAETINERDKDSSINKTGTTTQEQQTGTINPEVVTPEYQWTEEEMDAYKYAYKYGITTLAPRDAAMPDEYVIRGHMAKMVVNYALNVLHRKIPEKLPKQCKWKDGRNAWESQEIKEYAEKACALGLMGMDMEYFQPYKLVTRAQFGTIFGRLLWGKLVSKPYYAEHLARLKKRGIMTQIDRPEERIEVRKWAWLMFMRSEKYFKIDK